MIRAIAVRVRARTGGGALSPMLSSMVWRYAAIGAQFVIVVLVARTASLGVAGKYFSLFGLVVVASTIIGLGSPDGLVRLVPRLLIETRYGDALRTTFQSGITSALSLIPLTAIMYFGAGLIGVQDDAKWLAVTWWIEYAALFWIAQVTVALGSVPWGSFLNYSAMNFAYLLTVIPYLIGASTPTLSGILVAANAGGVIAFCLGAGILVRRVSGLRPLEASSGLPRAINKPYLTVFRYGIPIGLSRLLQAALPWIPVWVFAIVAQPESSAIYAAGSRLAVIVTSVLAALRFAVRPTIVRLWHEKKHAEISKLSWRATLLGFIAPAAAIAVLALFGHNLVPAVLGGQYAASVTVLIVLMVAVLGEAVGGISDEILKMTGHAQIVVMSLGCAAVVEILGTFLVVSRGPVAVAWVTAAAFFCQYLMQVIYLRMSTPIKVWPIVGAKTIQVGN